jgi:hypothetical protein|nr:MAG TPA: hypothetical protein [Caudoviricetes sp.]
MSRPKGSKNKPKLKNIIAEEILQDTTGRKKRGRKSSREKLAIPVVNTNTAAIKLNVTSKVQALKEDSEKPKRKRRTKAEMQQARQLQESSEVITDKQKSQQSLKKVLPKLEIGKPLFYFDQYLLTKFDNNNFALWLTNKKDRQVFLGYYSLDIIGFKQAVTNIATRLLTKVDDDSYKALLSANSVLKALDLFRVFLDTNFKS